MKIIRQCVLSLAFSTAASAQTVVEYINAQDFPASPSGQFFYSADPSEQAFVDSGGAGRFRRTGNAFAAGGSTPLCRFYGSVTPGPNSHFYTIDAGECAALRNAQITPRPSAAQQWNYEGNGYSATPPVTSAAGVKSCAEGTFAVYRAYNNAFFAGGKRPWDSNHRYATRRGDIDYLTTQRNWSDEGIVFCVRSVAPDPTYAESTSLENKCVAPRAVTRYGDRPGTIDDHKTWVRSYVDERYLWYDEVPRLHPDAFDTPQGYFEALRTYARTASGKEKDEFHFNIPTTQWEAFESGDAGVAYGIVTVPAETSGRRFPMVAQVEPSGPAGLAGVRRGMELRAIDGRSVEGITSGATLGALIRATTLGQLRALSLFDPRTNQVLEVSLAAARVTTTPVQSVKIIERPNGRVGYFLFNDFVRASEGQLIAAVNQLKAANVNDVVLDLRYNSGGFIYIASQLSYMFAGEKSRDKTFQRFLLNRKRVAENNNADNVLPFYDVTTGASGTNTVANAPLPTLNLQRVFILTSDETASASESVINGLRGIDVEVVLIGATTTGKPFGFLAEENCGTTYLTVEFQGVNAKGFGDFADGFAPTCTVPVDDITRDFGDPLETRLAAALAFRDSGQCPAGTRVGDAGKAAHPLEYVGFPAKVPGAIHSPDFPLRARLPGGAQ